MSKRDDKWPDMPEDAPERFESWLTDPITAWLFDILRAEEAAEKNALAAIAGAGAISDPLKAIPLMLNRGARAANLNWLIHGLPKQMEKKVKGIEEREEKE